MYRGVKRLNFQLIGISLSVIGVPWGMYLNQMYPYITWSTIVMALSLILMMPWRDILTVKWRTKNGSRMFWWILLFQCYMLLIGLGNPKMTNQYMFYHLYIILFVIAISQYKKKYNFSDFPTYLAIISYPALLLGVFFCGTGLVATDEAWNLRNYTDTYFLEPFTIANGALICFFSSLCCNLKKKSFFILCCVSFLLCIYTIMCCGKRSPLIVLAGGVIYFFHVKGYLSLKRLPMIFVIIVLLIILLLYIPEVRVKFESQIENITTGVHDIFLGTSTDMSGSAVYRYNGRVKAYHYIQTYFGLKETLFGAGYLVMWIDNPILESFVDMGIIGLVSYVSVVIFFPIIIAKKWTDNNVIILCVLLSLYNILTCFNSGNPYQYIKYVPICLLLLINSRKRK